MLAYSPKWCIWIINLCKDVTRPLSKCILLPHSQLFQQLIGFLVEFLVAVKITQDVTAQLQN